MTTAAVLILVGVVLTVSAIVGLLFYPKLFETAIKGWQRVAVGVLGLLLLAAGLWSALVSGAEEPPQPPPTPAPSVTEESPATDTAVISACPNHPTIDTGVLAGTARVTTLRANDSVPCVVHGCPEHPL